MVIGNFFLKNKRSTIAIFLIFTWILLIYFVSNVRFDVKLQKNLERQEFFQKIYNQKIITKGQFPGKFNSFYYKDIDFYTNYKIQNKLSPIDDKNFQKAEKILFFGDSFMMQYFARVEEFYRKNKSNIISIFTIKGSCFLGIDKSRENDKSLKKSRRQCIKTINVAIDFALKNKISKIVIANSFENYFNQDKIETFSAGLNKEKALNEIIKILKIFKSNHIKTYVILAPVGNFFILNDLKRKFSKKGININLKSDSLLKKNLTSKTKEKLIKLKPLVYKIYDPIDFICDKNEICSKLDKNGYPIFKDNTHLSDKFVKENMRFIDEIFLKK